MKKKEIPIFMSCSNIKADKTVSTGFKPVKYNSLVDLAKAMFKSAHSPSIYSLMHRWTDYKGWTKERKRRLHNISFIGNILCYDFDDGTLTFKQAQKVAKNILEDSRYPILLIRSKSDPEYEHDRFKMIVVTDFIYPIYKKDQAPKGFQKVDFHNYKEIYMGFAKKYRFYKSMDKSTNDATRLIAQVTTNSEDDLEREYVIIS